MTDLPERLTRAADLEVHDAEDGVVVFNPATDKVHHLNPTASALFELCDGSTSNDEVARLVGDLFGLDEPPIDAVLQGLRQLVDEGVLVGSA